MNKKTKAELIYSRLKKNNPNAKIALKYSNPFELAVATILSAQCTDIRVNKVTQSLFKKYKTPDDYGKANVAEFENDIRSTGFFRNKAKNIINMAKIVTTKYGSHIPRTMEQLITLPGIARKTANVILYFAFKKNEGIAVDTHVKRLSVRLGLSNQTNPDKTEQDLLKIITKTKWGDFGNQLIWHGRNVCFAKNPNCAKCILNDICPTAKKILNK